MATVKMYKEDAYKLAKDKIEYIESYRKAFNEQYLIDYVNKYNNRWMNKLLKRTIDVDEAKEEINKDKMVDYLSHLSYPSDFGSTILSKLESIKEICCSSLCKGAEIEITDKEYIMLKY